MNKEPWELQWERVKRLATKIEEIYVGTKMDQLSAEDTINCFFINCYHLKDYLIHGKKADSRILQNHMFGTKKKDKEKGSYFGEGIYCMRSCRDIALGLKHLKVDDESDRKDIKINSKSVNVFVPTAHLTLGTPSELELANARISELEAEIKPDYSFAFKYDSGDDALKLSQLCLAAWQDFLETSIFFPPKSS